jgi:hypothetical protein
VFQTVLFVLYIVVAAVTARRYFRLRHGLSIQRGGTGKNEALAIGLIWPIALFLEGVRHPTLCDHHYHVLERDRLLSEFEHVEEIKRKRGW